MVAGAVMISDCHPAPLRSSPITKSHSTVIRAIAYGDGYLGVVMGITRIEGALQC